MPETVSYVVPTWFVIFLSVAMIVSAGLTVINMILKHKIWKLDKAMIFRDGYREGCEDLQKEIIKSVTEKQPEP